MASIRLLRSCFSLSPSRSISACIFVSSGVFFSTSSAKSSINNVCHADSLALGLLFNLLTFPLSLHLSSLWWAHFPNILRGDGANQSDYHKLLFIEEGGKNRQYGGIGHSSNSLE